MFLQRRNCSAIFRQLFKGEQEINSRHTARQAKSRDIDENRPAHNCEMSVLICVKSKHGCSSRMMSWTFIVRIMFRTPIIQVVRCWENCKFKEINVGNFYKGGIVKQGMEKYFIISSRMLGIFTKEELLSKVLEGGGYLIPFLIQF